MSRKHWMIVLGIPMARPDSTGTPRFSDAQQLPARRESLQIDGVRFLVLGRDSHGFL